jgi:alpha-ketoglutarate-dependent taurine dioxygenase
MDKTTNVTGVEINIDTSSPIDEFQFNEIQELLFKSKVVVIKKQQLTDKALLRFATKFGTDAILETMG